MILTSTTKIEVVTSSAEPIHIVAAWSDIDKTGATAYTPGEDNLIVSSATTSVPVDAPASAGIYRVVAELWLRNTGAATNTVTVRKDDGVSEYVIESVALAAGESLRYDQRHGWDRYTAIGERMTSGRDGTDGATGPAGVGTSGTAELDFGSWPGGAHATVAVTGQATITGTSRTEAWIFPAATADHSADEHVVESIRVVAGPATAGVGFTIHGTLLDRPGPVADPLPRRAPGGLGSSRPAPTSPMKRARLYGKWSVAWRWS